MLIFNPKPSLSGAPPKDQQPPAGVKEAQSAMQAGLEAAKAKAQTKASTDAVTELLPHKDGSKVLYAQEVAADQPSQEAAAELAKLMTPQVLTAIPKVALAKYLKGMVPLVAKDKAKALFQLDNFVSRLRVWPILNQIYLLATNEQDPSTIIYDKTNPKGWIYGSHPQADKIASLVVEAVAMLPKDNAKTGDQARKDVLALPDLVQKLKAAEVEFYKAQSSVSLSFPLYEKRAFGESTSKITWAGPVAVKQRVASFYQSQDGKTKLAQYPVPNIAIGTARDKDARPDNINGQGNPSFPSIVPATADFKPYSAYDTVGMDRASGVDWNDTKPDPWVGGGDPFLNPTSNDDLDLISDQAHRIYEDNWSSGAAYASLGTMIAAGLAADPEWGGGLTDSNLTPSTVQDKILPTVRSIHDKARQDYKTPFLIDDGSSNPNVGAYVRYQFTVAALKSAIVKVCFVVPTEWKWEGTSLLKPTTPNWDQWLADVSLKDPLYNNLYKLIEKNYSYFMKLKADPEIVTNLYATVIALLQDAASDKPQQPFGQWIPNLSMSLPTPFLPSYKLDLLLASLVSPSNLAANAALEGLTIDQVSIVNVRATMKSATLLAMKASELGVESQELTDSIIATLIDLCKQLYGCTPTPWPPDPSSKLEDLVDYYKKQLTECMKNPAPESLSAKLVALIAQYKDLKAKADAGEVDAQAQLDNVAEQIAALTAQMAELSGVIASMLKDVVDNTVESGGTLDWINLSNSVLKGIDLAGKIKFSDGVEANLGQTPEETQAQQDTKAQNEKTELAALQSLALVQFTSDVIKTFVDSLKIPVADVVLQDIADSGHVADDYVPDPPEKKTPWWLLLAAVAAVAANRNK